MPSFSSGYYYKAVLSGTFLEYIVIPTIKYVLPYLMINVAHMCTVCHF